MTSPDSSSPRARATPPVLPVRSRTILLTAAMALLVVGAGCTGVPSAGGNTTPAETTAPTDETAVSSSSTTADSTDQTTEPHTAKGTSHTNTHLEVDAAAQDLRVEIRLYEGAPAGNPAFNETYEWGYGDGVDLTREVHELDPAYAEIVVNGTEVWNGTIREYEMYRVSVDESSASVEYSVV